MDDNFNDSVVSTENLTKFKKNMRRNSFFYGLICLFGFILSKESRLAFVFELIKLPFAVWVWNSAVSKLHSGEKVYGGFFKRLLLKTSYIFTVLFLIEFVHDFLLVLLRLIDVISFYSFNTITFRISIFFVAGILIGVSFFFLKYKIFEMKNQYLKLVKERFLKDFSSFVSFLLWFFIGIFYFFKALKALEALFEFWELFF